MDRLGFRTEESAREIQLCGGEPKLPGSTTNYVHSSKYSWTTFVPLTLAEVLLRPSTLWFVVIILIEANPFALDYDSSYGTSILFSLYLLMLVFKTMKSAQRYRKSDRTYNDKEYLIWTRGEFRGKACHTLRVGDCVLLNKGESAPADMLLLSCSTQHAVCHFDINFTIGESNLAVKSAVAPTFRFLQKSTNSADYGLSRLHAVIKVEQPNPNFSSFSGTMKLPWLPRPVPLKVENFLLRGSVLVGEDWALAVALYVGRESKFWSNVQHAAVKFTYNERKLDLWIIAATCAVLLLSAAQVFIQHKMSQEDITGGDFLQFVYLYQNLVPITLYISMNILRVLYGLQCSDKEKKVHVCSCAPFEDLGRVQYVLADKTGTITENRLEFVAVLLGSQMYTKFPIFTSSKLDSPQVVEDLPFPLLHDISLSFDDLKQKIQSDSDEELLRFCECVTLCNSVVILKDESMLATSADEEALMQGAKDLGFELIGRGREECDICYFDQCHSYEVLGVKKFSSDVKRMRILVKQEIDDFATLYIKGAYTTLRGMINMAPNARKELEERLKEMEERGLRTMVLCYRHISGDYLAEVRLRAQNAMSATLNIDGKLEVLFQELEQDLGYLGVTGVVDHCAADVPEAIAQLGSAGIGTWLMSGEGESHTLATAHQIGLIEPGTDVVSLRGLKRSEDCQKRLMAVIGETLLSAQTEGSALDGVRFSMLLNDRMLQDNVCFALAVDGESFETALRQHETQQLLLSLMLAASTICFHSLSPGQKREIANLINHSIKSAPVVLSIGDNINDMPMLLETTLSAGLKDTSVQHVCDVTVSSFSALVKLMLHEGRRSTLLISQMSLLFLYSQSLYALVTLTLAFHADYTPYSPVCDDAKTLFGTVFTLFPILLVGASGLKDSTPQSQDDRRQLTKNKGAYLEWRSVAKYVVLALLHYAVISSLLYCASYSGSATDISTNEQGALFYLAIVCAVNMQCLFTAEKVSVQLALISALSTITAFAYFSGIAAYTLYVVLSTPRLLLGLLGAVAACAGASLSQWLVSLLWDSKPQRSRRKVAPLRLHNREFRRIKKSASALLQDYSRFTNFSSSAGSNFEIAAKSATFESPQTESDYQRAFLSANKRLLTIEVLLLLAQALVPLLFELIKQEDKEKLDIAYKATAAAAVFVLVVVYALRHVILQSSWLFSIGAIVMAFVLNIVKNALSVLLYYYTVVYLLIFIREKFRVLFPITVLATFLLTLASVLNLGLQSDDIQAIDCFDVAGTVFSQVMCHILLANLGYFRALEGREQYKTIRVHEDTIAKSDSILACLLPEFVRKQVRDGIRYIAEDKGKVSVIFIEICEFDQICARYAPQELMALLDDIFQKIDEMCTSLGVAKIETVGKTYLACAGLRDYEFEENGEYIKIPHAKRCLDLAFAVLSSFRSYKLQSDLSLAFKIGVNTGEVMAGVVGHHKPQFSLVGDTVNTGSRMCTTVDRPNAVQVSNSTYEIVSDCEDYLFEQRRLEVKGKGEMTTYVVTQVPFGKLKKAKVTETTEEAEPVNPRSSLARGLPKVAPSSFDQAEGSLSSDKVSQSEFSCFCRSAAEAEFRDCMLQKEARNIRLGLILFSINLFALFTARLSIEVLSRSELLVSTVACFVLCAVCIVLVIFVQYIVKRDIYPWLMLFIFCSTSLLITLDSALLDGLPGAFVDVMIGFLCVVMYHSSGLSFKHTVIGSVLVLVPHGVVWDSDATASAEHLCFLLIFGLQNCVFVHFSERRQRAYFRTSQLAKLELSKTEQLLTQMMPVHAYENLKREVWSTDRLTDVTILYADIAGFTGWSSQHSPQEVIGKLSRIVTAFDMVCESKRMYKVHTIGDCYVALSSTSNAGARDRPEECARMVSFALEMASIVEQICREDNDHLKMRIGLHVGEVTAGITGSQIVRYDIYGPDVLVANKMESNGREGRVNVSADAKRMLERCGRDEFRYEFNCEVHIREITRTTQCFFVSYKE